MIKNKPINKIIIIHEYGEPSHYNGLLWYAKQNGIEVQYRDFNLLKKVLINFRKKNYRKILKAFMDFIWFIMAYIYPGILRKSYCIVGVAPFDMHIIVLNRILAKCAYIYHTSWLYWDGSDEPKKICYFKDKVLYGWNLFFEKAAAIATVTESAKKNINNNFPSTKRKTNVVYHAFDESIFYNTGNKNKKMTVLFIGRIETYKGIYTILEIAKLRPHIDFHFIGSGKEVGAIQEASYKYCNVKYFGFQKNKKEIARYLNDADFVFLPSQKINGWEELFGIALIESMACGCIPVATKHQGPESILSGTYFDDFLLNEDAFINDAVHILDKLSADYNRLQQLKCEAMLLARKFSLVNISKRWERMLNNE